MEYLSVKHIQNLSAFSNSTLSAQKTYSEGIDVIRSIHLTKDSFSIVSTLESRTSGPAEAIEGSYLTLDLAKETLLTLCKEDDEYYE